MRLQAVEIRPGRVLELNKEKIGYIKVEVSGIFTRVDNENLPWIRPFFIGSSLPGTLYLPKANEEVWVMADSDNPYIHFWFDKHSKLIPGGLDVEKDPNAIVVFNRDLGSEVVSLLYTDSNGLQIKGNSNSVITLEPNGNIQLTYSGNMDNRTITIGEGSISLGKKDGSTHPATLADKTQDCFDLITQCLKTIKQAAQGNAYTTNIATAIGSFPDKLKNKTPDILSKNVTLE